MIQPTALTEKTFEPFVRAHAFAVVHFWASWNGYDAEMKSTLQTLLEDWAGKVEFGAVDTSPPEHWDLCRAHKILNLPFVAFYRDGVLFSSFMGMRSPEVIEETLRRLVRIE